MFLNFTVSNNLANRTYSNIFSLICHRESNIPAMQRKAEAGQYRCGKLLLTKY